MIYPANFEQKIGFDRLREQVAALCSMQAGRKIIEAERFSTSREDIEFRQDIADEMRVMLMLDPNAPRDEYPDMEGIIEKIGIEGAFLDCEQVAILRRALTAVGAMVGFITSRNEPQYPRLRKRSERVCVFPDVIRRINQLITSRYILERAMDFYAEWKDNGMNSWDFRYISGAYDPETDMHMLNNKKVIILGNSYVFYGRMVLPVANTKLSLSERINEAVFK